RWRPSRERAAPGPFASSYNDHPPKWVAASAEAGNKNDLEMKRALLLWDIDGTLLLTDGAGMRGMARASRRLYGEAFRWDGVQASGRLDPLIFEDALAKNGRA